MGASSPAPPLAAVNAPSLLTGREVQHISAVARLAPIARLINVSHLLQHVHQSLAVFVHALIAHRRPVLLHCTAISGSHGDRPAKVSGVDSSAVLHFSHSHETSPHRSPGQPALFRCSHCTADDTPSPPHSRPLSRLPPDTDREAALEAVLRQHQDEKGGQLSEGALQLQLREVRTRQLLLGAGLGCYRHLAGDEAATIITILYSDLPLREDRPGGGCCTLRNVQTVLQCVIPLRGCCCAQGGSGAGSAALCGASGAHLTAAGGTHCRLTVSEAC